MLNHEGREEHEGGGERLGEDTSPYLGAVLRVRVS